MMGKIKGLPWILQETFVTVKNIMKLFGQKIKEARNDEKWQEKKRKKKSQENQKYRWIADKAKILRERKRKRY